MKAVIALAADYGYLNQVETALKSIFYHTPRAQVFLANQDIPQEWFLNINAKLAPTGSHLFDLKINLADLTLGSVAHDHINQYSYLKMYLPGLIDADRILYLDSDLVVDRDLTPFLNLEMAGHPLAATPDIADGNYNTGVILIDVAAWQAANLTDRLVAELNAHPDQSNGDQSLISAVAREETLPLSTEYNNQVGMEFLAFISHWQNFEKSLAKNPFVTHYLTDDKTWNLTSAGRQREKWWFYHSLEWSAIAAAHWQPRPSTSWRVLIFTATDYLPGLEALLRARPDLHVDVAAWVPMSFNLQRLLQYPNLGLHPRVVQPHLNQLIQAADALLILGQDVDEAVLTTAQAAGKPIVGWGSEAVTQPATAENLAAVLDQMYAAKGI